MRWLLCVALVLLATACPRTSSDPGTRAPAVCSGIACATGQLCCFASGRCFDPSIDTCGPASTLTPDDAGAGIDVATSVDGATSDAATDAPAGSTTAVPGEPPAPSPGAGQHLCYSDFDCTSSEYCVAQFCLGPGVCWPRSSTGGCWTNQGPRPDPGQPRPDPPPGTVCQVCGCDGVTYAAPQIASRAGARVAGEGACGMPNSVTSADSGTTAGQTRRPQIPCGNDSQCGAGQRCCSILGACVDSTCATCCRFPPSGARWPCRDDLDCGRIEYCAGDGCGTPGGCVNVPGTSDCSGVVEPVCGCNGRTYTNDCWARGDGTRIAASGACP